MDDLAADRELALCFLHWADHEGDPDCDYCRAAAKLLDPENPEKFLGVITSRDEILQHLLTLLSPPTLQQLLEEALQEIPKRPGRGCTVCASEGKRRTMRAHLRHLHEVRPGTRFRFHGDPREFLLEEVHIGRCVISTLSEKGEEVTFSVDGEEVRFTASASSRRPCTPYAMVIPIEESSDE